jgi:hypothetical protein
VREGDDHAPEASVWILHVELEMRRPDRKVVLVLDPVADEAQRVGQNGDARVEQQREVAGGRLDALLTRGEAAGALLVEHTQRQGRVEA